MKKEFEMTNLEQLAYFLGLDLIKTDESMFMNQKKYINDGLKKFNMNNCNLGITPMETRINLVKDEAKKRVGST